MVNSYDSIRFRNVISKRYRFYYEDMGKVMEEFINDIVKKNISLKGPVFYSLNNVPMDKMMNVELFMPVIQDKVEIDDDMFFHSYFSIENMISVYMYANFEQNTEIAYRMLLDYIDENNLKQATPIFHVLSGDKTMQYAFIKVGVTDKKEEKQVEQQNHMKKDDLSLNEIVEGINSNYDAFK